MWNQPPALRPNLLPATELDHGALPALAGDAASFEPRFVAGDRAGDRWRRQLVISKLDHADPNLMQRCTVAINGHIYLPIPQLPLPPHVPGRCEHRGSDGGQCLFPGVGGSCALHKCINPRCSFVAMTKGGQCKQCVDRLTTMLRSLYMSIPDTELPPEFTSWGGDTAVHLQLVSRVNSDKGRLIRRFGCVAAGRPGSGA